MSTGTAKARPVDLGRLLATPRAAKPVIEPKKKPSLKVLAQTLKAKKQEQQRQNSLSSLSRQNASYDGQERRRWQQAAYSSSSSESEDDYVVPKRSSSGLAARTSKLSIAPPRQSKGASISDKGSTGMPTKTKARQPSLNTMTSDQQQYPSNGEKLMKKSGKTGRQPQYDYPDTQEQAPRQRANSTSQQTSARYEEAPSRKSSRGEVSSTQYVQQGNGVYPMAPYPAATAHWPVYPPTYTAAPQQHYYVQPSYPPYLYHAPQMPYQAPLAHIMEPQHAYYPAEEEPMPRRKPKTSRSKDVKVKDDEPNRRKPPKILSKRLAEPRGYESSDASYTDIPQSPVVSRRIASRVSDTSTSRRPRKDSFGYDDDVRASPRSKAWTSSDETPCLTPATSDTGNDTYGSRDVSRPRGRTEGSSMRSKDTRDGVSSSVVKTVSQSKSDINVSTPMTRPKAATKTVRVQPPSPIAVSSVGRSRDSQFLDPQNYTVDSPTDIVALYTQRDAHVLERQGRRVDERVANVSNERPDHRRTSSAQVQSPSISHNKGIIRSVSDSRALPSQKIKPAAQFPSWSPEKEEEERQAALATRRKRDKFIRPLIGMLTNNPESAWTAY